MEKTTEFKSYLIKIYVIYFIHNITFFLTEKDVSKFLKFLDDNNTQFLLMPLKNGVSFDDCK